jgi:FMN phosphatase YigB (HAD superfamily)
MQIADLQFAHCSDQFHPPMPKSLPEYLDWLDGRSDLIWPKVPAPRPLKATPSLKPLPGIKAVTWSAYGTLLTISDGRLLHVHPQQLRMQIALEKTIEEFNMWQSMSRKPGQPWEYMLQLYRKTVRELEMVPTRKKGDAPEIDSSRVWFKLLGRLDKKDYQYDAAFYGDLDALAVKVAYFFHANLQGSGPADGAVDVLRRVSSAGLRQGLLADAQPFTLAQLQHALRKQRPDVGLGELFSPDALVLSCQLGIRKPSPSLYAHAAAQFRKLGIDAAEVLHVSHRLQDDLAVAREYGFRTALLAADANCCPVQPADVREAKPDRLLTNPHQISQILGI